MVTVVSLPENPPIAATSAPEAMIAWLAPDWLEMTSVPPPLALMYVSADGDATSVSPPNMPAAAARRSA